MKQVRRSGLSYSRAKLMGEVILELKNKIDVLFLGEPEEVEVLEYKNDTAGERQATGEKCVGFDKEFATIYYRGFIFYIQPSEFYPFTDDNYPALINFIAYQWIGTTKKLQLTYFLPYKGIESLDNWVEHQTEPIGGVVPRSIDPWINSDTFTKVDHIVGSIGGYRENAIWAEDTFLIATDTWNSDHKVVRVVGSELDEEDDGVRRFFEVDLVSNTICG